MRTPRLSREAQIVKRRFKTPSPAMMISLVALFVALGGTTYAATSLPKNSVGTKQLKNGAVTKKKISRKTIRALKGNQGPPGPKGDTGARGPQGIQGVKGPQGLPGPSIGNFTNCGTAGTSSHADGTGIGQQQVADCTATVVVPSADSGAAPLQ